ncbi:MAG: GTPase Era [Alphaproteobacteria bacterium]|nr:GTPase Era [Alphaproteobacteria bacterium]
MTKKQSSRILITGFPNAGKSSLINLLFKRKISIVSNKIQTTNQSIQAILNYGNCQMIFIDTPGIIEKTKYNSKKLSREIFKNIEQIDINLFIYDVTKILSISRKKKIKDILSNFKKNYLILNKIDLISNEFLLMQINQINSELCFSDTFPLSVKKKIGISKLLDKISKDSPEGKWMISYKNTIDKDINFLISEITREKIFNLLNKEIPYVIKVESSVSNLKSIIKVEQKILVEKESQKAIIIGKRGSKIKDIGTRSRNEMEKIFKKKVFLDLKVFKKLTI